MEVVSTTCCESANIKLHQCVFTDLIKLDETNAQRDDKLHQAGKIHNFHESRHLLVKQEFS